MPLIVTKHPAASCLLSTLRKKETSMGEFRVAASKLTTYVVLEALRECIDVKEIEIETPLETTKGHSQEEDVVLVPILRAGLSMLEPSLQLVSNASVGYIGLERNEEDAVAKSYYQKTPNVTGKNVLILDPMLATGGSALKAIEVVLRGKPRRVTLACIVAAPEGVREINRIYRDVNIYTASLDRQLNQKKYILPGLGDFGDRLFGT